MPRSIARPVVQDRTLYEDAEVFAAHLHEAGYIDARDWAMYQDLYRTLREEIRPPDLMIYLRCPLKTLARRIQRRGRDFERKIPRSYLASLERLYEAWYARYDLSPTLVIEIGPARLRRAPLRSAGGRPGDPRAPRQAFLGVTGPAGPLAMSAAVKSSVDAAPPRSRVRTSPRR